MCRRILPVLLCICILFLGTGCTPEKYPSGRDTVESFGDGTFQILRGPDRILSLRDESKPQYNGRVIESNVLSYRRKGEFVYVIGESGYTVLNYETGEVRKHTSLDELPDQEQKVFRKMLKK